MICRAYNFAERAGPAGGEYEYELDSSMTTESLSSSFIGGTGGTPFTNRCNDASVVTGISGRSGAAIDQLAFRCTSYDAIRSTPTSTTWVYVLAGEATTGMVGGTGGTPFTLNCPVGYVVRGIQGYTVGGLVQALSLRCAPMQIVPQ